MKTKQKLYKKTGMRPGYGYTKYTGTCSTDTPYSTIVKVYNLKIVRAYKQKNCQKSQEKNNSNPESIHATTKTYEVVAQGLLTV